MNFNMHKLNFTSKEVEVFETKEECEEACKIKLKIIKIYIKTYDKCDNGNDERRT